MQPPFPSLTPTWHNDIYPEIEYTSAGVTHKGETIIITGAGSGIGRETALAFAAAGAKQVVLIGRTSATLNETASLINKAKDGVQVTVLEVDVTDDAAVADAATKTGTWNVLVHCAGYITTPVPAGQGTNVKSTILLAKHLLPKASQSNASFLTMAAGGIQFPTEMLVGNSAYLVSKLALSKTTEFLAAENTNIFFASVHPGMVDTKIFRASGATPEMVPTDTPQLPAGFMLWITKPEAKFLNGKTVWVNWDVTELKAMKESITTTNKLNIGLAGWPFTA
ncbi:NADP(+)-dependent dehydrogenase [Apiospora kogelbergensis]|uniref:NADP(+)-dependent dehydrogenase n=1 Tax=Apiospora kogelbergensis TaxID=1337665 RepID=UPI0031309F89